MFIITHTPGRPLDMFVEKIIFFAGYVPAHQREKIIPDGAIQIIVDLHDRTKKKYVTEQGVAGREFARSWISGMQITPVIIEAQQHASLLIIRFRPGGARPFLGFASEGLNGEVEPFENVLGSAAANLRERVLHGKTASAKLAAAEAWLHSRLCAVEALPPVIAHLSALQMTPGLQVSGLADQLGYSTRQLRNIFHAWVGLGPKQFLQVGRFNSVVRHLSMSGRPLPDWAGLAQDFGYVDQPHLAHDFRRFANMSPGNFLAQHSGRENFLPIHVPRNGSAFLPLPISTRRNPMSSL